jgi:hypothetical protein
MTVDDSHSGYRIGADPDIFYCRLAELQTARSKLQDALTKLADQLARRCADERLCFRNLGGAEEERRSSLASFVGSLYGMSPLLILRWRDASARKV